MKQVNSPDCPDIGKANKQDPIPHDPWLAKPEKWTGERGNPPFHDLFWKLISPNRPKNWHHDIFHFQRHSRSIIHFLKPYVWWLNLYYSWLNHHFWWITSAVSTQTILTFTASKLRSRSYHVAHAEWHRLRMGRGVWYNLWPDVLVHQCPLAVLPVLNVTNGFIYFLYQGIFIGGYHSIHGVFSLTQKNASFGHICWVFFSDP